MENNRFCVIMCGGVGSRFWPYSREKMPKQFIDFLGTGKSLLQMTVDRIRNLIPIENVVFVSNVRYKDFVTCQCPEIKIENILLEPIRKNTASSIAWATQYIYDKDPEASIIVLPSDHIVSDQRSFERLAKYGFEYIENQEAILTMGILVTRPETGYGYVKIGNEIISEIFQVEKFVEKPEIETAKYFYHSGSYLWNAGIFFWQAKTILKEFDRYCPEIASLFSELKNGLDIEYIYRQCPSISIDYAIMEKSKKICTLKADMGWSDLGTWNTLFDLSGKDENQNVCNIRHLVAKNSYRNIIKSTNKKLVAIFGISDCIIADTEDVLFICPRSHSEELKSIVEKMSPTFK